MTVESIWKILKHNFLHFNLRPRLDLSIWILLTEVIPAMVARAHSLNPTSRGEHTPLLSPFFAALRKSWRILAKRSLGHTQYVTDIATWTCSCGAQARHAQHLCKHLVQAAEKQAGGREPDQRKLSTGFMRHCIVPLYQNSYLRNLPEEGDIASQGSLIGRSSANKRKASDNLADNAAEKRVISID